MFDPTQAQGADELQRARDLSLRAGRPPGEVPGYEPRRFLGAGAYGEVWVALDRTTGRQVAIKFYLHRGGLDWSLLAHEVEKLAFLSADRYVVQLLDVGWDTEPPYFVMEYVERGSLEERLHKQQRVPAAEAVPLFRDIAIGLLHAHGKGVLHCDLKPANILLDQDGKPRLADFGQSRLSHEQTPALGTLFYMAPEQADMEAVPDARWDVYALGAILYTMLTGNPPHRHEKAVTEIERAPNLAARLTRYRKLIVSSPPPDEHRRVRGVDKRLAEIIDRCLAVDPQARFPNIQTVLDALDARETHRSRRPLVVLGALGPLLLLGVMSLLAWLWFNTALRQSNEALTRRALQGLQFAAESVATGTGMELAAGFRDVEEVAANPRLITALAELEDNARLRRALDGLSEPNQTTERAEKLLAEFNDSTEAQTLQSRFEKAVDEVVKKTGVEVAKGDDSGTASWFIDDARGLQIARKPPSSTLAKNYSWRTYFHGGQRDQAPDWRPQPDEHITRTQLSAVYRSQSSDKWVVAISTPIFQHLENGERRFLGIVARSLTIGKQFVELPEGSTQYAVLVDARDGDRPGLILQHPVFNAAIEKEGQLSSRFENYRIPLTELPDPKTGNANFADPLADDEAGTWYRQRFLAAQTPIELRDSPAGWVIVVVDSYDRTIGSTLNRLRSSLLLSGLVALALFALVILGLWWLVIRMLEEPSGWRPGAGPPSKSMAETLPATK